MAIQPLKEDLGTVKEQYELLMNPQPHRIILLLKYPNRNPWELYSDESRKKPLELRIKPKCGLVEVDVPIDVDSRYDKEKGIVFGSALRRKAFKGHSNLFYGLSSGLDRGMSKNEEIDPSLLDEQSREKLFEEFDDANDKGYVMNKITLGGRIEPFKDGDPMYMLTTFDGDICTWTPLDGMVMLRPQFEHLDALRAQQKTASRSARPDEENKKEAKAEDVNMTVKDTEDDEPQDDLYGGMAETLKILRAMADEPWQRLQWVDSETQDAYSVWEETLVFQNAESAPKLVSEMTQEQYLDAISCPRVDPINRGRNIMRASDADPDDFGLTTDEEKSSPMGRPKDARTRYLIEGTCREICSRQELEYEPFIKYIRKHFKTTPEYAFLKKSDPLHRFFLWRLKQNKSKRGWSLQPLCEKNKNSDDISGQNPSDEPERQPDQTYAPVQDTGMGVQEAKAGPVKSMKPLNKKRKTPQRGQ